MHTDTSCIISGSDDPVEIPNWPAVASGYESDPMLTHLLFVQSLHSVITGTHFYKPVAKLSDHSQSQPEPLHIRT